ncbi:ABC transporter permease [Paenibacillus sp. GCM10027626]|uniref:ABC transporter permease n=1 Tax=Paenibacillus sp. GCM10027626 TaxID=3273411 RepID=UPI00363B9BFC
MNTAVRKILSLITTVVVVSVITFFVFQILPGNPVQIILGVDADERQMEALEEQMGLDKPAAVRYLEWVGSAVKGDLGTSIRYQLPVAELIGDRLPVTMSLAVMSLILTLAAGVPLGIYIASRNGKVISYLLSLLTQLGIAIPSFWLGILLIFVFSVILKWFPAGQYVSWSDNPWEAFKSLLLPSIAIAISNTAVLIRYIRNTVLDQLKLDYVRTARSKGLGQAAILYKHVIRNASIPVLTVLGMIVADTLGGSIIVENVFSLPGLGNLLVSSINSRDLPMVQAMVLYIGVTVIMINFLVDLLYKVVDPRIGRRG